MSGVTIPQPRHRMSATDAGFLYLDRPHAPLHIGCIAIVEGELGAQELTRLMERRLSRLWRYRQRAMPVPFGVAHPSWEDDPDFDVRNHLFGWSLPAPGGARELAETAARLLVQPLDRERPLWEMHVLGGLDDGRTAVLQKVHHCMVDGASGVHLLEQILDETPDAEDPSTLPPFPLPRPSRTARLARALGDELGRRLGAGARLLSPRGARESLEQLLAASRAATGWAGGDLPRLPWNGKLGRRRALELTRLPMAGVKQIKTACGGTVNDIVLCALAGGLDRYLEGVGVRTAGLELLALVPVSLRAAHEQESLGNRIAAMRVPLAMGAEDERVRLRETRGITDRLKRETAWSGIEALLDLLEQIPAPLVAGLAGALPLGNFASLLATNVPGPREVRYLRGRVVEALYPIAPIRDGLGLSLAVFSYAGWLYVGVHADPDLIPDLEKLRFGIEEAFAALLGSA